MSGTLPVRGDIGTPGPTGPTKIAVRNYRAPCDRCGRVVAHYYHGRTYRHKQPTGPRWCTWLDTLHRTQP